jgi:hypothetical protein
MIARSVFVTQCPPQRISVETASAKRGGGGGCLPRILVGVVLLVPAAGGASVARLWFVRRSA